MKKRNQRITKYKQNDWGPQQSVLLENDIRMLKEINSNLEKNWFKLVKKEEPVKDKFLLIKDEAIKVLKQARIVAQLSSTSKNHTFDEAIHVIEKWTNIAAYAGVSIPNISFPTDHRESGEFVVKNSLKTQIKGVVVSDSMDKTISVLVKRKVKHPIYGKYINKSLKYLVHDEYEQCEVGDTIVAVQCRPLSKRKRHSFLTKIN